MSVVTMPAQRPLHGIACMLAAAALFVGMDSLAKYLGDHYSPVQLAWSRYSVHLIVLVALLAIMGRLTRAELESRAPWGQFGRGLLLLGATLFAYLSVRVLPLTQVYVVNFSSPLIVTLLAIPLLKEKVGAKRLLAAVCGFSGVLIAVQPDVGGLNANLLLPVGMAVCFALYQLATRYFAAQDSALTSLLYTATAGGLVSTLAVPFFWVPVQSEDIALFVLIGVLGALSHFALIEAMRSASASLVSPFLYSQLIWATLIGYWFFGDYPTKATFIGAGLVAMAGGYLIINERHQH
ncbi:DMT family transporter [Halomonas sp. QX-2]|uniref:DMT family transporter n=1 Tax=Vreelandella sedimenti TaxID=2729618 RepID=A0A7Z0N3P7_9GAMM|nr:MULTISPECIES: DMT family transporter [Halomonas]NYT71050.1 DMT family transporter [Halomonas sedimenti]|tara:strand:- start:124082 stop:124963 length:882 start_codon:yes stop_codon:yes gene_type:complete